MARYDVLVLARPYADTGLDGAKETISYCRIGERSSHSRLVLHELRGHKNVKHYDGSWTEYGSLVGRPDRVGKLICALDRDKG